MTKAAMPFLLVISSKPLATRLSIGTTANKKIKNSKLTRHNSSPDKAPAPIIIPAINPVKINAVLIFLVNAAFIAFKGLAQCVKSIHICKTKLVV